MSQIPGPGYGQTPPPGQPHGYSPGVPNQPYGPPQQAPNQPYGPPEQAPNQPYGPPQQAPNQPYGPPQQAPNQPYGPPEQAPNQRYGPPQPQGQPYLQPQSQPYGQPGAYGQPQQVPNPYGQPPQGLAAARDISAYGTAPTPQAKGSQALGAISLALVVVCGIVLSVSLWRLGGVIGQSLVNGTIDSSNEAALQQAVVAQLGGAWALTVNGSGLLGLVGWVLGIVATATRRGRAFGVATIVLGVLAPIVALAAMVVAMAPYLS